MDKYEVRLMNRALRDLDYPLLGNIKSSSDVVVFYPIFVHKLPGSFITDTSEHLAELGNCHHIGILGKTFAVMFPVFYIECS